MATPTKRHMNWTTVTFTDYAGSPVTTTLTGVTSIDIDPQGSVKKFSGDGDRYTTTLVNDHADPQVTIQFADLAVAHVLVPGYRGALSATHNDAKNGITATGGGYTVALTHAMVNNNPSGGKHREFGEASVVLSAESTDGVTNPLSFTSL